MGFRQGGEEVMHSYTSTAYGKLITPPIHQPSEEEVEEKAPTDQQFLFAKKKEDNYQDQLLIQLIPLLRQFDFLPKSVLNSSCNKVLDHIYPKLNKRKETSNDKN